jgi:hypothetical protein
MIRWLDYRAEFQVEAMYGIRVLGVSTCKLMRRGLVSYAVMSVELNRLKMNPDSEFIVSRVNGEGNETPSLSLPRWQ